MGLVLSPLFVSSHVARLGLIEIYEHGPDEVPVTMVSDHVPA